MRYTYDPFQEKAIAAIQAGDSVLVSAPTGSGKTAIAEYAIERALELGERVIYTAPIKAISNQKYRDFTRDYPGKVGILTGDVSIDPHAQVLIMTTEIYRNQLFESPDQHRSTAWVIFDEVHYLDDLERGTVWEEAFMFSRPDTRFLALSATAPNIREVAAWIQSLQKHRVTVIEEAHRPVELVHLFQCQNEVYEDLERLKKRGYMGLDIWSRRQGRPWQRGRHGGGHRGGRGWEREMRARPNSTHDLLRHLVESDKLPCLYFAFGRKRVEELAHEHMHLDLLKPDEREENRRLFRELGAKYDLLGERSAAEMERLVEHGIAYHHAGLLPTLKEVVEQIFTRKRIRLIFTTETFALGINMPARTVIFDELRKFYGFGFDNLTTRDYYQMAGRAGRRNLDTRGYVYSRVNPHDISHSAILRIVKGRMEPIQSQFNASYATLLNLYRHFGRKLLDIYPKSFHAFQSGSKRQRKGLGLIERKLGLLQAFRYVGPEGLTAKGEFAACIYGYELVLSELLETGLLDHLAATDLCVLLAALVYEPRRNEHPPHLGAHFRHLDRDSKRVWRHVYEAERRADIRPLTRAPHFHLAAAMEAWTKGAEFHELARHTEIDEGIIIRYFRTVIQILRQFRDAPAIAPRLRELAGKALPLVNRDIVDAEKLLRSF